VDGGVVTSTNDGGILVQQFINQKWIPLYDYPIIPLEVLLLIPQWFQDGINQIGKEKVRKTI